MSQCIGERLRCFRGIGLDIVAECIKANRCQYMRWHSAHYSRIYDGNLRHDSITAQRFFIPCFRISKYPKTITFRAGTTGCRNDNKRQRIITDFTIEDIVVNITVIDSHEGDAFCTIHDGPTADSYHHIATFRFS